MPTLAVTGASGRLGRLVVADLLDRGVVPAGDVVAVVRDPASVADLADRGVQVRRGDYDEPGTLPSALAGVDRLLLVSGSEPGRRVPQHTAVVEAAVAAGVGRLVYTSILGAPTTRNPLAPDHRATEEVLRAAAVPVVVLRNGWYTENWTDQLGQYLATGELLGATGGAGVSAAARADFAVAAASALLADHAELAAAADEQAEGFLALELGGPAFTLEELAAAVTEATGTTVVSRDLGVDGYARALVGAGLDEGTAGFVASLDGSIAAGELRTGSGALERLLGRPATPLVEVVRAAAPAA
ncbi:NAD(P)H-binding protein [Aquipuribacter hungaricus]|uniref:NAD(P)H-binding protein n=1 Tax=Aquipuribacter hungaricus TaxID=545624 RepID=A0ABV7WAY5_9MICO